MRLLLLPLLLLLAVAALAALASHFFPGPVQLSLGGWIIEAEPVIFSILLVVALLALHLLLVLISTLWRLPERLRKALDDRRRNRAQAALAEGLDLLLEGSWAKAEQRFRKGFDHPGQALHCRLGAAEAAFRQGDRGRCLYYLKQAGQGGKKDELRAGLLEARLLRSSGEEAAAAARLEDLRSKHPGNQLVGERLLELYRAGGNWIAAAHQAERLPMPRRQRDDLLLQAHLGRLRLPRGAEPDREQLERAWQEIPRKLRRHPRMVKAYVTEHLRLSAAEHCEPLLRKTLGRAYDPELAVLYALVQGTNPARQLAFLEQLLRRRPDDPRLLLATGMLSGRMKLWGKARSYIEQSRAADPRPENLRAMAHLLEQQGEFEAAARCYRQGLDLISSGESPGMTAGLLPARTEPPRD